ncbi:peptidase S1 and S6 chymotrypsin/Hap [Xylanimonas cellulosilytica DSM 15894]|uniref:Peptidase S1 and S6 chymotrypsin/Hap n=1 Tax=Xylanimonas cellulosilytica (strain DSM 15894 / JCM 12276 / CECT 5975 / KCTC 9989 / LMG 20990 / NBRC 107835 / XIL07) TaxID=446471 RepID=D1BR89_XYLCX|nr:serine protease [Xylanimonas cellulosilytica]ACZ30344.1 peptidase S1 and S6 chymotrypsin/Hap [Xylanimonas cellulosilytica DSM 15894]
MSARARRARAPQARARALLAAAAIAALAGCGTVPPFPGLPSAEPSAVVASDLVPEAARQAAPSLAPSDAAALSPDGFDAVQRMAVRIRNIGCGELSTGSGFAIDANTLITNRHVVADAATLQVSTYDGRDVEVATASTAGLADLAVVRTEDALPSAPELGEEDPVLGERVTVVGYPEGGALTITQGTVIGTRSDPLNENLGEVLVTDARVEPGSSGSAALDDSGRVVGVVYAKTDDGRSLLVPVSTLRAMLADTAQFTPVTPCS